MRLTIEVGEKTVRELLKGSRDQDTSAFVARGCTCVACIVIRKLRAQAKTKIRGHK